MNAGTGILNVWEQGDLVTRCVWLKNIGKTIKSPSMAGE